MKTMNLLRPGRKVKVAFISGYSSRMECPICGVELKDNWTGSPLGLNFDHPIDGMIDVNGYPSPCPNNGNILERCDVKKVTSPIIHTSGRKGVY